ncbi:MAG: aminoglycoside phosphotransferase family protein [Arachidicoccus sp.]|nr:aminoglycoside phosphotransferase family protein [Arachidicoccus sp.]
MIGKEILGAFGLDNTKSIEKISNGLINLTYKAKGSDGKTYLLQRINTKIFPKPIEIQENYLIIQDCLSKKNSYQLPAIISTKNAELLLEQDHQFWRCFDFISGTHSMENAEDINQARQVAHCFGKFSADLSQLQSGKIHTILPNFHDLRLRFTQFEQALQYANEIRKKAVKSLIDEVYKNKQLVEFYDYIIANKNKFPLHILHHDCKMSNILFKSGTNEVFSPIDLDTTQPGYFFSDLGDMIRSIVPNLSENETDINKMKLRTDFYQAIKDGYLESMQQYLTIDELSHIDQSGKIIIYMQAVRFLTDYLNNDIYYQTDYPAQNKDRAENQFKLLFLLSDYINHLSDKTIYA